MTRRLPTADDVIIVVKELIAKLGADAFEANGHLQLYSGPSEAVAKALRHFPMNHARAVSQSQKPPRALIDNTQVGRLLANYANGKSIYEYFEDIYGRNTIEANWHPDAVMRFASREYIKASFGQVATAVCGADTGRVFFEIELPELVSNTRIETINGIDMNVVRESYHAKGAYAAFRKICQAEIVVAKRRAQKDNTKGAWNDYSARRQFFMMERKLTIAANAKAVHLAAARISAIHSSLAQGAPLKPESPARVRKIRGKGLQ